MKVLTEADLRTEKFSPDRKEYHVAQGIFVTPLAREYLQDHKVSLIVDSEFPKTMTRMEIKDRGKATYISMESGEGYQEKPEEMTHLRGNLLIPKTHPRIALRGWLDYLQAEILLLQVQCAEEQELWQDLEEVLLFLRSVLGAEVKEEPLGELSLFGLNHSELRRISHQVKTELGIDHPIPNCRMGETTLRLNLLRTQVRRAELAAVRAFPEGDSLGLIKNLNRLSSGIYILFCRKIVGFYEKNEGRKAP